MTRTDKKNYPLLLGSQFLSAMADNALLSVIIGMLLIRSARGMLTDLQLSYLNIFYTSLLFVPYLLAAPLAGYLNDRFSKVIWLTGGNCIKLAGVLLCFLEGSLQHHLMAIGYFVVGIGATVYSPAKYGILPEILPTEKLVKANGMVELLTLVGILGGSILGGLLIDHFPAKTGFAAVAGIYILSLLMNLVMSHTPANPAVRFTSSIGEFVHQIRSILSMPRLARILLGTGLFWICGAMMKMNFPPWGKKVLHLDKMEKITLLGLWLAIGIMVGSVLAGRLYRIGQLHHTRRYGFALGLTLLMLSQLYRLPLAMAPGVAIALLILAGIMAGLFLIPLNAALQAESPGQTVGKTIAVQNSIENFAMLGGTAFAVINVHVGMDPSQLFLSLAVLVMVVALVLRFPLQGQK